MAYLRGSTYVWPSRDHLHVWVADGDDGWKESGWAVGASASASGVAIGWDALDEFVLMRFAELVRERGAIAAGERAIAAHRGNGGCVELVAAWDTLRGMIVSLDSTD